jgi:hypothetical protein
MCKQHLYSQCIFYSLVLNQCAREELKKRKKKKKKNGIVRSFTTSPSPPNILDEQKV